MGLFTLFAFPVQAGASLHQAPYLIERGINSTIAATIVGTFSFMSALSSLGLGAGTSSYVVSLQSFVVLAALSALTVLWARQPAYGTA